MIGYAATASMMVTAGAHEQQPELALGALRLVGPSAGDVGGAVVLALLDRLGGRGCRCLGHGRIPLPSIASWMAVRSSSADSCGSIAAGGDNVVDRTVEMFW